MDPVIGSALISAGGGLLSGLFGQSSANKQMKFQEKSARHRYQWAMEDMRKAGLNPILAYKQGGAPAQPGARATMGNIGQAAVEGASSAKQRQVAQANIDLINQQQLKAIEETKIAASTEATTALQARIADDAHSILINNEDLREAVGFAKAMETIGGPIPALGALGGLLRRSGSVFKAAGGASKTGGAAVSAAKAATKTKSRKPPSLIDKGDRF